MKLSFKLFLVFALSACSISMAQADIIAAPGTIDLGMSGDTAAANASIGDFLYGRNAVTSSSDGTEVTFAMGSNNFNAISIGFAAGNNATNTNRNAFAGVAGDVITYSVSLDLAGTDDGSGNLGTPSFQYRLNEGSGGEGERISLAPTVSTMGTVSTYTGTFTLADVNAPEAVDRFSLFIATNVAGGFAQGSSFALTAASVSNSATAVPEPSSLAIFGLSALGLLIRRRKA